MLAHAEAHRLYSAARESHIEHTGNTLKHSCSHKWETLKGLIFGVKPSIPLSEGPEVVWWWLLLRKPTPGLSFDSKQCREQFVIPLCCFPQSRCNSLAFQTSVLQRPLLVLDTYGRVDPLGVFPPFLKKVVDITAPKQSIIFVGSSIWDNFWSVSSLPM